MAIYAYCLLRLPSEETLPELRGIDGRPVFPLRCDKHTMLVSRLERDFDFSPRSIVEHGQVITKVFENRTVLPIKFGTFFRSEKQVIDLVRENRQALLEAFCRLRGKAEMRVKLLLGFGGLDLTARVSESKSANGAHANGANGQRKLPNRSLAAEQALPNGDSAALDPQCREVAAQLSVRLREMFQPLDQQVTCRRLESSQLLVDCAHLIEAEKVVAYQKLCGQASTQVKDCDMRVSGPWPPYHFLPGSVRLPAAVGINALRSKLPAKLASLVR